MKPAWSVYVLYDCLKKKERKNPGVMHTSGILEKSTREDHHEYEVSLSYGQDPVPKNNNTVTTKWKEEKRRKIFN